MSASDSSLNLRDFYSLARELNLLSPEVAEELAIEAGGRQITPGQLALQKGLLDATQIDIIETLLRPAETVPGYEILDLLGQGGMGVVYRARQLNLRRIVALKTVLVSQMERSTALERFEQEALAVARLSHPHIIAAYDFGRHEGRLYFAMELVSGEDVHQLIRRRRWLDEWTVWGIVRQAAAGLAHAAQHGIVHRDVKPANLLLVEPPAGFPLPAGLPMVKVADFGLAQLATAADERTRLTMANVAVGSPNYMSPEQLLGESVDLRTDIFALGASAFHMLTGQPPQSGKIFSQIVAQRVSGAIESVHELRPDVSSATVNLVADMMARDPRDRLADYRELTRRIEQLDLTPPGSQMTMAFPVAATDSTDTSTLPLAEATTRVDKIPRRIDWKWPAVGLVALLAILVLAGLTFRQRSLGNRDLKPSGRMEELFNGQNINQWKLVSGGWGQAKNDEGALVLQGRGLVRRPIAGPDSGSGGLEHYRLMFVVDLHEASAVELQFDLCADGLDEQCLMVRIDQQGSTLGRRDAREPAVATIAQKPPSAGGPTLHAVEIERHSQGWWAYVDGESLGSVRFAHARPALEFRLLAEGGFAWFSDFTIEELEPAISK